MLFRSVILLFDDLRLWVIRKQVSRRKYGRTQRGGIYSYKRKRSRTIGRRTGGSIFLNLFHSKNRKMKGKEPTMEPKGGSASK